ncbi:MAG: hypothetical protein HC897_15690 [Thermoanaerobaculia bacterium]|nr:hypothetical protein [Thermoanaerobaculia bacterium]
MTRPRIGGLNAALFGFVFALLGVVWLHASVALAQESEPATQEEAEAGASESSAPGKFGTIDDLIEQDQEVLSRPGTYSYDPGARRDPFRSLVRRRDLEAPVGERPEGIAGLLIDELEVQGIFVTEDGPVAQVMSASQPTSLLLRPGDRLWDGDVVSISLREVIFKQTINDPTALKPFREVVKQLNP